MPRKQTTTSNKTKNTKPAPKSESKRRAKPKEEVVEEPEVVEEQQPVPQPAEAGENPQEGGRRKRRVSRETVMESLDALVSSVETEVARLRETQGKAKGVKYLRSLGKQLKTLRTDTARVMKHRQRTNRPRNTTSGFMKPVPVSKDMAKFAGWNANDLKSRVDVTKTLCEYIKTNNLQNPEDRRQILADSNLCKLLRYDPKKGEPLTYYKLQQCIQHLFPQTAEVKA
jgi:chromatin remodeling complex protein RSC6